MRLHIGQAAKRSGATVKAIRHYEQIGLLTEVQRIGSYRVYEEKHIQQIQLIKCAQQLGFSLKELGEVVREYDGIEFPWEKIQTLIQTKISELELSINKAQQQQKALMKFQQSISAQQIYCSASA
jgi:MerR family copper efflux transcriptional regulator